MSKTPILDRDQPLPVKSKEGLAIFLAMMGIPLGFVLGGVGIEKVVAFFPGWYLLFGFLPAYYFAVLLHELGHVAAGVMANFEFRGLMVGALLLRRNKKGWKLQFLPKHIFGGGTAIMSPNSADQLRRRHLQFVLGGPAATLALLTLTLALTVIRPDSAGVRVLLIVNLLVTLASCLPYTSRGQTTDAKYLWLLGWTGPASERLGALLQISFLDSQQIEPRHWPRDLVEKMSVPTKDLAFLADVSNIRVIDAALTGDVGRLAELIESALSMSHEFNPDMRRGFYAVASSFQAFARNNVPLAEAWLQAARSVNNTTSFQDWDSKALAGIAHAKGERIRAQEYLTRYLNLLDTYPPSGIISMERASTVELLNSFEEAAA